MSLRRRIAERIATPLKRAGVETPVLEQIPHRAEELAAFYYEAVHQSSRGQIAELLRIPAFAHGKAYGETAGFWYRVSFPKPIMNPTVVCVGEARRGDIPRSKLVPTIPKIPIIPELEKLLNIPTIEELKKVLKEKIPDLTIPKWTLVMPTADAFVDLVKNFLGDWGIFNWMRDAIAWAIGNFEYAIWDALFRPRGLEKMNELLGNTQDRINDRLEKIRGVFNTKLGDIDDRLDALRTRVNDRLPLLGDGVDERLETLRTGVNDRVEEVRNRLNDSFETVFPRLYDAWGLRRDMALTALHIRNVTSTSFEFQSFGKTTAYWIAIGTRA